MLANVIDFLVMFSLVGIVLTGLYVMYAIAHLPLYYRKDR